MENRILEANQYATVIGISRGLKSYKISQRNNFFKIMRSRVTQQVSGQSIASGLVWSFNISARPTVAVISLMTFNELGKETNNKTNEGRVRRKGEFKEWVEKLRPQNWWKVLTHDFFFSFFDGK